jgi:peptidyl-prolyl cis-trans isomerase B (cyclophilin B)
VSNNKKIAGLASERLEAFESKQKLEASKATRRMTDNRLAVFFGAGAVVLALVGQFAYFSFGPGSVTPSSENEATDSETSENSELVPSPELAESRIWTGSMQVGDATLELELDGVNAPQAVANFIDLSSKGLYYMISCHRLTSEGLFVLQCGDPDGTGGPGYNFGPIENAPADDVYLEGALAMARVPNLGDSMGSQFFIVYNDSVIGSDVVGGYTVFGKITKGLEQLAPIIEAGVEGGGVDGRPALPAVLGAIELR